MRAFHADEADVRTDEGSRPTRWRTANPPERDFGGTSLSVARFAAKENTIKRDEIAARQLPALKQHYIGKLRLFDVVTDFARRPGLSASGPAGRRPRTQCGAGSFCHGLDDTMRLKMNRSFSSARPEAIISCICSSCSSLLSPISRTPRMFGHGHSLPWQGVSAASLEA
jgi:hypothetical protein